MTLKSRIGSRCDRSFSTEQVTPSAGAGKLSDANRLYVIGWDRYIGVLVHSEVTGALFAWIFRARLRLESMAIDKICARIVSMHRFREGTGGVSHWNLQLETGNGTIITPVSP